MRGRRRGVFKREREKWRTVTKSFECVQPCSPAIHVGMEMECVCVRVVIQSNLPSSVNSLFTVNHVLFQL